MGLMHATTTAADAVPDLAQQLLFTHLESKTRRDHLEFFQQRQLLASTTALLVCLTCHATIFTGGLAQCKPHGVRSRQITVVILSIATSGAKNAGHAGPAQLEGAHPKG